MPRAPASGLLRRILSMMRMGFVSAGFLSAVAAGSRFRRAVLIFALAAPLAGGCGSLTPYAEARKSLPNENLLRINGQYVYHERTGKGPAVLLLHGFGASSFCWRKVVPALAESNDVIAVDMNGFGYTERPFGTAAYSTSGQAALAVAVLDKLGVDSAVVVGHSYGAGVAAYLAQEYPDRVHALVFVDGGAPVSRSRQGLPAILQPLVSWWVTSFMLNERAIGDALRETVRDPAVVDTAMVAGYLRPLRIEGLDRALRGLTAPPPRNQARVEPARIRQPTLIVWGREDEVIPLRVGESLLETMPDARLHAIEECGHLPMEERAQEFGAALREFLSIVAETSETGDVDTAAP